MAPSDNVDAALTGGMTVDPKSLQSCGPNSSSNDSRVGSEVIGRFRERSFESALTWYFDSDDVEDGAPTRSTPHLSSEVS